MFSKYKNLIFIFAAILLLGTVSFKQLNGNLFSGNTMLVSKPIFTINPNEQNLDIGQSFTFTITNNSYKTIIPNWSFSSGYEKYIDTTECKSPSITCTIKTINGPANLQIIASYNNGIYATKAKLNISSTTYKQAAPSTTSTSTNPLYINPSAVYLDIGESFVFESYAQTTTGTLPVKTNWSVADNGVLDDSECKSYSTQCKIKTLSGPVETKVTGELNGEKAEALVEISSAKYQAGSEDQSPDLYIDPEKIIIKKGERHTFTSYNETSTSQIKVESAWTLDTTNLANTSTQVAKLEDCDNSSSCVLYAGMNEGKAEIHAKKDSKEAIAYVEILNEVGNPFTDDLPLWAQDYIISLYNKKIISGYTNGRFGPADSVSRGQFVTMLYRLVSYTGLDTAALLKNKNCNIYSDLKSDSYAYEPICFASNFGWLGDEFKTSTFKPEDPMSREIAAEVIYYAVLKSLMDNAFNNHYGPYPMVMNDPTVYNSFYDSFHESYMHEADKAYSDVAFRDKYNLSIGAVKAYNVMKGSDGAFRVKEPVNRAEIAVIMWRLLWNTNLITE